MTHIVVSVFGFYSYWFFMMSHEDWCRNSWCFLLFRSKPRNVFPELKASLLRFITVADWKKNKIKISISNILTWVLFVWFKWAIIPKIKGMLFNFSRLQNMVLFDHNRWPPFPWPLSCGRAVRGVFNVCHGPVTLHSAFWVWVYDLNQNTCR